MQAGDSPPLTAWVAFPHPVVVEGRVWGSSDPVLLVQVHIPRAVPAPPAVTPPSVCFGITVDF